MRVYVFASLLFFTLIGCKQGQEKKETSEDGLFKKLSSEEMGISFTNRVIESDTLNIMKYEYFYNGGGVGVGDFNNDGYQDLFFCGNMTPSALYLNRSQSASPSLNFEDITQTAGVDTKGLWTTSVTVIDINGDDFSDIYVCARGYAERQQNLFYINNGKTGLKEDNTPTFTERAVEYGLDAMDNAMGAAFFDYDRDGDLDMYLMVTEMETTNKNIIRKSVKDGTSPTTDKLFQQEGMGSQHFVDVSSEAGITLEGFGLGLAITDINQDGWPDIYVANDYLTGDILYINDQKGGFTDRIDEYLKHQSYNAMGVDIADFNNDGWQDIITLDMEPNDFYRQQMMVGGNRTYDRFEAELANGHPVQYMRNTLQLNLGNVPGKGVSFSEIGQLTGLHQTDWSWSVLMADFDNDTRKDVFISNGIPKDITNKDFAVYRRNRSPDPAKTKAEYEARIQQFLAALEGVKKHNFIYKNQGDLTFEDKTSVWGFAEPTYSNGTAYADLDNDGDLDLVTNNLLTPAGIYENTLMSAKNNGGMNYLKIELIGSTYNRQGIGAKVILYIQDTVLFQEQNTFRGYRSTVDDRLHFGVGKTKVIDSLWFVWPDGKQQKMYQVPANHMLALSYENAEEVTEKSTASDAQIAIFHNVTGKQNLHFKHEEQEFVDFKIQPLIHHQYSKEGPGIAVADVNSDGLEDFYIGGTTKQKGTLFLQDKAGSFFTKTIEEVQEYEDMGVLFFDADNDQDVDLYLVSGGTGLPPSHPYYKDRLYINDGKGSFTLAKNALPETAVCGSQVTAADYDRDGDLDLFVGGRVSLENFPLPQDSYLLQNDSDGNEIHFKDVTNEIAPKLRNVGLVTSALWTDFDNDGWVDLLVTGEWMPVKVFKNENGQLIDITKKSGLYAYSGWWNSITGADFDKDGDIDYVAGNLGLNTRYKVNEKEPMRIFAKDYDNNGTIDPVSFYYIEGEPRSMYTRDKLFEQMASVRRKFPKYADFASADMNSILTEKEREGAYQAIGNYSESSYIENLGNGKFQIKPLPRVAQLAPVFGILAKDYDHDGNIDILLTGNSFSPDVQTGRYDASIGLFLKGDGKGNFTSVNVAQSGFYADGDTKGIAELRYQDDTNLIIVGRNNDTLLSFQIGTRHRKVAPAADEYKVEINFEDGSRQIHEFYYGNTYLSQSSRLVEVSEEAVSVKLTNYQGKSRTIDL